MQLHTMETQDTGLSRMLLWWTWKMGMPAVSDVFYPGATTKSAPKAGEGAAAVKSLLFHQGVSASFQTGTQCSLLQSLGNSSLTQITSVPF